MANPNGGLENWDFDSSNCAWIRQGHITDYWGVQTLIKLKPGAKIKQMVGYKQSSSVDSGKIHVVMWNSQPIKVYFNDTFIGQYSGSSDFYIPRPDTTAFPPGTDYLLTIENAGTDECSIEKVETNTYTVDQGIKAYADKPLNYVGKTISFFDVSSLSSQAPVTNTTWLWDFGDGQTSNVKNPTHVYTAIGVYIVTLTTDKGTRKIRIEIIDPTPLITISSDKTSIIPGQSISFKSSLGWNYTIGSGTWDFGDGQTSTTEDISHTFATAGTYNVKFTATNEGITTSKTIAITVRALTPPVVDFSATSAGGLGISFKDLSANAPTGWAWDFGETEDKTAKNPTHYYQKPGTYTVKLTATNADGSGSKTISVPVTVTAPAKPTADFSSAVPVASSQLSLQFTDQSTNTPTSWLWNFGDGQTSTEQNPAHVYAATGLYTVTLTATNINGSATISKAVNVQGGTPPPAKYIVSPGTVTAGTKARITISGQNFVTGSKIRIVKPAFWGTVSKIISFSSSEIVFDFVFGEEYTGVCNIALISSSGAVLIENAITVA